MSAAEALSWAKVLAPVVAGMLGMLGSGLTAWLTRRAVTAAVRTELTPIAKRLHLVEQNCGQLRTELVKHETTPIQEAHPHAS